MNAVNDNISNAACMLYQSQQEFDQLVRMMKGMNELTPQQRRVFEWVQKGYDTKSIARAMNIAIGTVKVHLAMTYKALGVPNRKVLMALLLASRDSVPFGQQDRQSAEFMRRRK